VVSLIFSVKMQQIHSSHAMLYTWMYTCCTTFGQQLLSACCMWCPGQQASDYNIVW